VRARLLALLLGLAMAGLPALARPGAAADEASEVIIADIVVEGGLTVTADTVSYYLGLAPGDPIDPELIAEGFHRLWDSGLFEDVRIEAEPTEDGEVILYVAIVERPFVTSVIFEGNKKLKESDLKDRLDERGIEVPRNVPLRMSELERIESAIKELYDEDGFRSAQVAFRVDEVSANKRQVTYTIDEGGKVKISSIDFVGNEIFSDGKLQGALKKTKETGLLQMFGDKTVFSEESWEEDRDNLRKFYLDRGYIDVKVGEPQIEMIAENPDADTLKKKDFKLVVKVPVEEGEPYAMGSLSIAGTKAYDGERLTSFFEVEPGQTYSNKAIEDGMEKVRDLYQNTGYFYAYTNQVWKPREGEDNVVDVVVDVFEGDRFTLGRLEFSGNTNTRDKVLRREFRIPEGAYMSTGVFRSSVFKVNALGYFKLEEEPVEFDIDEEQKRINVVVKGRRWGATTSSSAPATPSSTGSSCRPSSTPATSSAAATRSACRCRPAATRTTTRCPTPSRTSSTGGSCSAGRSSTPASTRPGSSGRRPAPPSAPASASAPSRRCPACSRGKMSTPSTTSSAPDWWATRRVGTGGRSTFPQPNRGPARSPSRPSRARPPRSRRATCSTAGTTPSTPTKGSG